MFAEKVMQIAFKLNRKTLSFIKKRNTNRNYHNKLFSTLYTGKN